MRGETKYMRSGEKSLHRKHVDWAWGYFFVLPTIAGLVILNIYPIFQTLVMSFSESAQFGRYELSGLHNYSRLLSNAEVWNSLRNTLIFTITSVPAGIALSIVLAALMSRRIRGVGAYRVLFFMPMVAAPAATAMVWRLMLNSDYGVLNQLLRLSGGNGISWLSDSRYALMSVVLVAVWSGLGQQIILMIGAITSVPKTYYEAALIDGANSLRKLISITLPLISPSIFFLLITGLIGALKQFDIVYMLYGKRGTPGLDSTQTIMHRYYVEAFDVLDKAYASSIVMLAFAVIMAFTVVQFVGEKKWVYYDD